VYYGKQRYAIEISDRVYHERAEENVFAKPLFEGFGNREPRKTQGRKMTVSERMGSLDARLLMLNLGLRCNILTTSLSSEFMIYIEKRTETEPD
jgi:hypothetical protein